MQHVHCIQTLHTGRVQNVTPLYSSNFVCNTCLLKICIIVNYAHNSLPSIRRVWHSCYYVLEKSVITKISERDRTCSSPKKHVHL